MPNVYQGGASCRLSIEHTLNLLIALAEVRWNGQHASCEPVWTSSRSWLWQGADFRQRLIRVAQRDDFSFSNERRQFREVFSDVSDINLCAEHVGILPCRLIRCTEKLSGPKSEGLLKL